MKQIHYIVESAALYLFFGIFKIIGLDVASSLGGWLGRTIGPMLGVNKRALNNLKRAFPELSDQEYKNIAREMWDHLGRIFAEYPHLKKIGEQRIELEGNSAEILDSILKQNKGGAFCGGHLGNWEANVAFLWMQRRVPVHITYRALNNPYADRLLSKVRGFNGKIPAYPKSRESGKHLIRALKDRKFLGILIDQKYNEGLAIPFFGHDAMTTPVFVQLAQKYDVPLSMVRCKRLKGANFSLTVHPPLDIFDEQNKPLPVEEVIINAHILLEEWIKDTPEQWLWLHRRWGSN